MIEEANTQFAGPEKRFLCGSSDRHPPHLRQNNEILKKRWYSNKNNDFVTNMKIVSSSHEDNQSCCSVVGLWLRLLLLLNYKQNFKISMPQHVVAACLLACLPLYHVCHAFYSEK